MSTEAETPTRADKPVSAPLGHSPMIRLASTLGIAAMALVSIEAMVAALCWSLQGLLGLPDWLASGTFLLLSLLGLWAAVWAAVRNWHVEKRLERGLEIDEPKWSIFTYLRKGADAR